MNGFQCTIYKNGDLVFDDSYYTLGSCISYANLFSIQIVSLEATKINTVLDDDGEYEHVYISDDEEYFKIIIKKIIVNQPF